MPIKSLAQSWAVGKGEGVTGSLSPTAYCSCFSDFIASPALGKGWDSRLLLAPVSTGIQLWILDSGTHSLDMIPLPSAGSSPFCSAFPCLSCISHSIPFPSFLFLCLSRICNVLDKKWHPVIAFLAGKTGHATDSVPER